MKKERINVEVSELEGIRTHYIFRDKKAYYVREIDEKVEHKKGEAFYLPKNSRNLNSEEVREGNYKITKKEYYNNFKHLDLQYTLKRKKNLLSFLKN